MKNNQERLVQAGVTALLPGMQHILEILEAHIAEYRAMLESGASTTTTGVSPDGHQGNGIPPTLESANPAQGKYPERIGENYTIRGAARKLGLSRFQVYDAVRRHGFKKILVPYGQREKLVLLTPEMVAQIEALRK